MEYELIERKNCYLCGSEGELLYQGLEDNLFGVSGEWNIVHCPRPNCGLAWLDPYPGPQAIPFIYKNYYTQSDRRSTEYARAGVMARFFRSTSSLLQSITTLERMRQNAQVMYLQNHRAGKLLDVGCGGGARLNAFKKMGWEIEGQEVDVIAATTAMKLAQCSVHSGKLVDLKLPQESYDAIVMHHVLEHVDNPQEILKECRRLLRPGGRFVCVIPNLAGPSHKEFGMDWRGLEPPRHFFHYSPRNLHALAISAGMTDATVSTSIVNYEAFVIGSYSIKARRGSSASKEIGFLKRLRAFSNQYLMLAMSLFRHVEGDECVLIWDAPS